MSNKLSNEEKGQVKAIIAHLTDEEERVLKAVARALRANEGLPGWVTRAMLRAVIEKRLLSMPASSIRLTALGELVLNCL